MPTATKKAAKTEKSPVKLNREELAAHEAALRAKYPHIVEGTLRNIGTDPEKDFYHKRSVVIACAQPECTKTRRIATSDLAQVKYCVQHAIEARRLARRKAK